MDMTILFLLILASLLLVYVVMLKFQVQGLLKSYKYYCKSFCSYRKMCRNLEDFPDNSSIDILKVVEQALYFYANNLLRDIQGGEACKLKVVYDCFDSGEKTVDYSYNPEPARYALDIIHAMTSTQPDTVIEELKNKIITGINTSLYNEILNTLIEIEKVAAYISSPDCKNRRREAKKILKLLQIIKSTREEII